MTYNPPWKSGEADIADDVYAELVPMDGYPKGTRGGPRIYNYRDEYWVVLSLSDFGDVIVGQWGPLAHHETE